MMVDVRARVLVVTYVKADQKVFGWEILTSMGVLLGQLMVTMISRADCYHVTWVW